MSGAARDPARFADHFSRDPASYARFRPGYPPALFGWLASLPERRERAWDCATGNGQAALPLAAHFGEVFATDGSLGQVRSARGGARVRYAVALGEAAPLRSRSVDLVTVAQALHWLEPSRFLPEAGRVLRPGGALAVWSYGVLELDEPVGTIVHRFYSETVGPYWPAERALVEDGYRAAWLPIEEVTPPPFAMESDLPLEGLTGYIRTWSAVGRFTRAHGADPVLELTETLRPLWGDPGNTWRVRWPLAIRAGRWTGIR